MTKVMYKVTKGNETIIVNTLAEARSIGGKIDVSYAEIEQARPHISEKRLAWLKNH